MSMRALGAGRLLLAGAVLLMGANGLAQQDTGAAAEVSPAAESTRAPTTTVPASAAPTAAPRPLRRHQIHPRSYALAGHDYLAAEGGDLDGDGRDEILLVRAGSLSVVHVPARGEHLDTVASLALPEVVAPLFGRRHFALARVQDGHASVRISDRPTELSLRLEDGAIARDEAPPRCGARGYALMDACAMLVEGRDYFASELFALPGADATPGHAVSSFYARRTRSFSPQGGVTVEVNALVNPNGRLSVEAGHATASVLGVGAALAMGDLEGDGEPELLTSVNSGPGRPERLLLFRVRTRDGRITRLYRSRPLEGRVMVAGAGDLDGNGDDELFAVEELGDSARLWVLP